MKRLAQSLILLSASAGVVAEPIFHPAGENLTQGPVGNFQSLIGHTNNPATGSTALDVQDWNIGFGLIPSFGFGLELGPVDNFADELESLDTQITGIDFSNNDTIESAQQGINDFLSLAGEKAYFQMSLGIHPIAPLVWNSRDTLQGSLVFDLNAAAQAKLTILDDEARIDAVRALELGIDGEVPDDAGVDLIKEIAPTRSSAYIKIGVVGETSLAYSRPVFETQQGTLHTGVRAKMYMAELRKKLVHVYDAQNAEQLVEDELDVGFTGETGFGVDLGAMWTSEFYRVGATVKNVNAPSFTYDPIGMNCDEKTGVSQDTCYVAQSFADEIDLEESWVMDAQPNVEFAVFTPSRNWFFAASGDLNAVNDPVGNKIQWFTASAGYATRNWLIPGFRVGYRKNMAGSQLSTANVGLSLFKVMHLDIAWGLENVKSEGLEVPGLGSMDTVPRMLAFNLGVDFLF